MTILERLATTQVSEIADMIDARRTPSTDEPADGPSMGGKWDNRPGWDNWTQKPPPFKKKTVYFKNK